jgi:hypothetical protein
VKPLFYPRSEILGEDKTGRARTVKRLRTNHFTVYHLVNIQEMMYF